MKERPILFSGEMVKAILEGRKMQTRRVIKLPNAPNRLGQWEPFNFDPKGLKDKHGNPCDILSQQGIWHTRTGESLLCPYGGPGDRLWVRETHYRFGEWIKNGKTETGRQKWKLKARSNKVLYFDNPPATIETRRGNGILGWFKRPSIFMPRWASRIVPVVTEIRVERVQEISEADAINEGMWQDRTSQRWIGSHDNKGNCFHFSDPHPAFKNLWDSINAKRGFGWDVNPWVWVVCFRRITP